MMSYVRQTMCYYFDLSRVIFNFSSNFTTLNHNPKTASVQEWKYYFELDSMDFKKYFQQIIWMEIGFIVLKICYAIQKYPFTCVDFCFVRPVSFHLVSFPRNSTQVGAHAHTASISIRTIGQDCLSSQVLYWNNSFVHWTIFSM